jgi:hypothetical protein
MKRREGETGRGERRRSRKKRVRESSEREFDGCWMDRRESASAELQLWGRCTVVPLNFLKKYIRIATTVLAV